MTRVFIPVIFLLAATVLSVDARGLPNLRAAGAAGLTIPPSILVRANYVLA